MLKHLTRTNVWMSLSVTCLTFLVYLRSFPNNINVMYLSFVFLASNSVYHFHRLVRHLYYAEKTYEKRSLWLQSNKIILTIWVALSGISSVILFHKLDLLFSQLTFLLLLSVLFYVIPFIRVNDIWIKLRDIPFFKIFLVAFIWALVSVFIPFYMSQVPFTNMMWWYFLSHFLLIFSLTLLFDIRDMSIDETKTFASYFGAHKTKILASMTLLLWCVVEVFVIKQIEIEVCLTFLLALFLYWKTNENSKSIHYSFYLESVPVVLFLLYLIMK
ncbi:MAG: hypothetical protein ACPG6V_02505 [Flavobacteriales bacterium]